MAARLVTPKAGGLTANRRSKLISLGAQIRAGRALAGWSQADLAKAAGLSERAVRYWEEQHARIIHPISGPSASSFGQSRRSTSAGTRTATRG
jgi:DNA-binding XRE family transcriptional regulator